MPQISTGDILREAVRNGTELGRKAKSYMDAGELVPDDVIIGLIRERLQRPDCAKGFILDGFPRTIPQAEALDRLLAELGLRLDAVIEIYVEYDHIVRRLTSRRICPNCGAVYNLLTEPPNQDGTCRVCGTAVVQREDDNEEAIRNRLKVYEEQTRPLKEYYGTKGLLQKVDGNRTVGEVFAEIVRILEKKAAAS